MDYPKSVPNIGLIDGRFVDENPVTGQIGSLIPAAWGDAITQEMLNVIKGAGLVPDEADVAQLLQAITLISASDYKRSVRCATTGPIALSGLQQIDGVSVTAGDRVLVKDQANGAQNWIYVVAVGPWARAQDANESFECAPGHVVPVQSGTANALSAWQLRNTVAPTLGTTALVFSNVRGKTVTPGSYGRVSVDDQGRVSGGSNPSTLEGHGVTDAYTKMQTYSKGETYSKAEAYSKDEVYGKAETYGKGETYSKKETYSQAEVDALVTKALTPINFLEGFDLSNNVTVPASAINVSKGAAVSAGNAVVMGSTMACFLNASGAWAAGPNGQKLDAGGRTANTWYHVFVIRNKANGGADVLMSIKSSAPALPAGYELVRRIGAIKTDAAGVIIPFINVGRRFKWKTPIKDALILNQPAGQFSSTVTLSSPPGVSTLVDVQVATSGIGQWTYVRSPDAAAVTMGVITNDIPNWLVGLGANTSDIDYLTFPDSTITGIASDVVLQAWMIGAGDLALTTLGWTEI